ncbi:MAG: TlpA family protein disulfide reductase [Bacteroidia bacterium]|nr:TlpA family protein disulfide reductase [Bacteroidia bacterium]
MLCIKFFILSAFAFSQTVSASYKINELLGRLHSKDTTYVVNFWATWCKPCIQELPAFDSLYLETKNQSTKVLLVCLDFKEELNTKVIPFLKKKNIQAECVLLDEVNGNDYINKISESWSGAIPATYFQFGGNTMLVEKKMNLKQLTDQLLKLKPN